MRNPHRQRGTVYLLVLSVTAMLVAIGVTAVLVGRVDLKTQRLEADQADARDVAMGVVEVVRLQLEQNSTWRSTHTHDVWSASTTLGSAAYRYKLVDEYDGDLGDDAGDPVRLYVEATASDAKRIYSVILRDGKEVQAVIPVATSTDDAGQETLTGISVTTANYARIGQELLVDSLAGLRFTDIPVQPGQMVKSASVQFIAYDANADPTTITITAEAHDDAPTFATLAHNIKNRTRTDAASNWSPGAWAAGDNGAEQRTPDLAALLQEVVDRPGWQQDNAMVLILEGTNARDFRTYDYSSRDAPVLHLTYTAPGLTTDYTTLRRELAQ